MNYYRNPRQKGQDCVGANKPDNNAETEPVVFSGYWNSIWAEPTLKKKLELETAGHDKIQNFWHKCIISAHEPLVIAFNSALKHILNIQKRWSQRPSEL